MACRGVNRGLCGVALDLFVYIWYNTDRALSAKEENEMSEKLSIETVDAGSFSMEHFKFGHGKRTLVILPGISVQSVMLYAGSIAGAYGIFAASHTVYVFDRRKELPASYSVRDTARDTAEAFRLLGLDGIDLFGTSQGGAVALAIAAEHPEMIHKLVLGSTSAYVDEAHYRIFESWADLARAGRRAELYLAFGEAVYPRDIFEQSRGLLTELSESVTDEDLARFIIQSEAMRGIDLRAELPKISCPALVIGSLDDEVLGADASVQIAKSLKGQKGTVLYMYSGYGHAVYDTAPDYKERLLSFLAQSPGQ